MMNLAEFTEKYSVRHWTLQHVSEEGDRVLVGQGYIVALFLETTYEVSVIVDKDDVIRHYEATVVETIEHCMPPGAC